MNVFRNPREMPSCQNDKFKPKLNKTYVDSGILCPSHARSFEGTFSTFSLVAQARKIIQANGAFRHCTRGGQQEKKVSGRKNVQVLQAS
jgi:hypothetical protein